MEPTLKELERRIVMIEREILVLHDLMVKQADLTNAMINALIIKVGKKQSDK